MREEKRRCRRAAWFEEVGREPKCPLRGAFPNPSWDAGEGWEETVHMQTSVTHSTEEHFFFVKGALTHLAMGHLGGGAVSGVGRGKGGCKGVLRLGA